MYSREESIKDLEELQYSFEDVNDRIKIWKAITILKFPHVADDSKRQFQKEKVNERC